MSEEPEFAPREGSPEKLAHEALCSIVIRDGELDIEATYAALVELFRDGDDFATAGSA